MRARCREQAKAELMAVKRPSGGRAPAPHQTRPLSAPAAHHQRRGGKKQWDDTTAPPAPAREP